MSEDNDRIIIEKRVAIRKIELAIASFSTAFSTNKAMNTIYAASTEG
jgi:hypothetical protein